MKEIERDIKVPPELASQKRWICWSDDDGKKLPVAPWVKGGPISINESQNWTDLETAKKYLNTKGISGLGFVLGNGIVGIDFDDCYIDGELKSEIQEILNTYPCYAEVSPSGEGLHILGYAFGNFTLKNLDKGIEIYSSKRYFTFTGDTIPNHERLTNIQDLIYKLISENTVNNAIDIDKIINGVSEGSRNDSGIKLATFYRKQGLSKEETLNLIRAWNKKNNPPMNDREVESIVESAYRPVEPYGFFYKQNPLANKNKENKSSQEENKDLSKTERRISICLKELENKHFITPRETEEIYMYKDGIYIKGETYIKQAIENILFEKATTYITHEVIEHLKRRSYIKLSEMNSNNTLIPLNNGLYNIKTSTLAGFTPEFYFTFKIPVDYDPEAYDETVDKFLDEITSRNKKKRQDLENMAGYCLYNDYNFAIAFMLVGGGSNGKSTFLNLLEAMLGEGNYSTESLQDLESKQFSRASLFGKLANIVDDLPSKALLSTEAFKWLTGGTVGKGEKKFKDSFNFKNTAKLIFSTNKPPEAKDVTKAFFRRWKIILFNETFEGKKRDPYLIQKLTTKKALSYFLNLALEGLERVLNDQVFSEEIIEKQEREYKRLANPIYAFVDDFLIEDPDNWVPKEDIYNSFIKYCKDNYLQTSDSRTFFKQLQQYISFTEYRPQINGVRIQAVRGIKYK